jgi:hypothetical protein
MYVVGEGCAQTHRVMPSMAGCIILKSALFLALHPAAILLFMQQQLMPTLMLSCQLVTFTVVSSAVINDNLLSAFCFKVESVQWSWLFV